MSQMSARSEPDMYLVGHADQKDTDFSSPYSEFGHNPFLQKFNRIINYSTTDKEVSFTTGPAFGKTVKCEIPKHAPFMQNVSVQIWLPRLVKTSGTFASWTNAIGYALIKKVVLAISGVNVTTMSGQSMDIIDEMEYSNKVSARRMMGKFDNINFMQSNVKYGSNEEYIIVPLRFWFTDDISQSLPLGGMAASTITITIDISDFSSCICYDGDTPPLFADIVRGNLLVRYHDVPQSFINEHMISKKFVYLVEQTQIDGEYVSGDATNFHLEMKFNLPVSSLYWAFVDEQSEENNDWFNYLKRSDGNVIMTHGRIDVDGNALTEMLPEMYYRLAQAKQDNVSEKCIYQMHFCSKLKENTGSMNMSNFDKISMQIKLRGGGNPSRMVFIAKNWNFLIIQNGFACIKF